MLNLFSISKAGLGEGHISLFSEFDFSAQWLSDTFCKNSLQVYVRQPHGTITSFCHVEDVLVLLYMEFNGIKVQIMFRWRQFCKHTNQYFTDANTEDFRRF